VWQRAVAVCRSVAAASAWVVVIVLALAVGIAVVIVAAVQCRDAWSLVWSCPVADSGGEGAAGGAPHPSVVVAAMPQSLLGSLVGSSVCSLSAEVVMGNSEVRLRPAKVKPSLVPTVVVVDISGFF